MKSDFKKDKRRIFNNLNCPCQRGDKMEERQA